MALSSEQARAIGETLAEHQAGEVTLLDVSAQSGWTDIFIYPGFQFRVLDGLLTNFHLPESTLIMLVAAFAGRDRIMAAYDEAIRQEYRFFSFGDAMLIWDGVKTDGSDDAG